MSSTAQPSAGARVEELARTRVAIRHDEYHLLDAAYRPLCDPHGEYDVYDSTKAELSDKRLCHRCKRLKRQRLNQGEQQ